MNTEEGKPDSRPSLPVAVSSTGYWKWDIQQKTVFFSDRLMDTIGIHRVDNILDEAEILEIVHPDDRPAYKLALDAHMAGETEVFSVEVRVVDDSGGLRRVINRGVLERDARGNHLSMSGSITDITGQRKLEDAIRLLVTATSGQTGPEFFDSLVEFLARSLDCDLALVGRLNPENGIVRTLGAWMDGDAIDNFEYPLAVSPCCNVVGQEICIFPEQVWRDYPDDVALAEGRFEGYAGAPLFDSHGNGSGLIAVLFRRPITDTGLVRDVLSIFALRAAAEIERVEREQALRNSERRFRDFASASADHFWETDTSHRFIRLQGGADTFRGESVGAWLGLAPWELPDVQPFEGDSWQNHMQVFSGHREFRGLVVRVLGSEGESFLSASALPVFNVAGEFSGYRGTLTDITREVRARQAEREVRERLKLAVHAADLFVWDWEVGAERIKWRTNPEKLLGPCPADGYPDFRTLVAPGDRAGYRAAYARCIQEGAPYAAEFRIRRTDGEMRWLSVKGILVRDSKDVPVRFLGVTRDVTGRREAEDKLRLAASVFDTREPIMITDPEGTVLDVNEAFVRLFGYEKSVVQGRTAAILRSGRHDESFYRQFWMQLLRDGYWQGEMLNRAKDGRIIPNWMMIDAVVDDGGRVHRYVATCSDISERKQAEERIQSLAWYDALTGLPNRRALAEKLEETLRDHRQRMGFGGLVLIDVDDFKTINESLGYQAGDALLISLAEAITSQAGEGDTLARVGSDEFAVLIPELGTEQSHAIQKIQSRAEAIMSQLSRPLEVRGENLRVSCSMGIHVFPEGALDAYAFLSRCETALNRAKLDGHRSARLFHPDMKQSSDERLHIQSLLSSMQDNHRIENFYQPQVDIDNQVIGVEALARLRDDDGNLLSPVRYHKHRTLAVAHIPGPR
jgi:diguanylate cyclase (GGDEF)-like protein/PAS domain S-box-containing protein